ncbi:MAG: MBL fold metallo-hydrolase [Leucothrix sp.]
MRNAVAAIFTCKDDVFSITRQTYLRAFPGYTAFPGGKVDEGDEQFAIHHSLTAAFPAVEIGALVREVAEELTFDLPAAFAEGKVLRISKFGTAVTPATQAIRFNAHFYKIELSEKPSFSLDAGEIHDAAWMPSRAFWEKYASGEALMVKPTMLTASALAKDISVESIHPFSEEPETSTIPMLEHICGLHHIAVPSNTLPPATTTNSLLVGDDGSPRILTDPSPATPAVLQQLINTLKTCPPDAILLTHHHPDHHERAPELARHYGIPILCTRITERRLNERWGQDYLAGITLKTIRQDEVMTQWLGHDVICHELPGHDDGMVGLAAANLAWFYVADLVEAGTTVVIPEGEGDMAIYFESLQRVIAMNPRVVIPSHGLPSGSTHLLEKTLKHRQAREQQINEAFEAGLRDSELTEALYPELNPVLIPYAEQNIRQHLRKLGHLPV